MEPDGHEWRKIVPRNVFEATLPETDNRTTFIACTMAPAIDGEARSHWKITREEVDEHCKSAVGKEIVDSHNNNELVGHIIAAGVDSQGRIWIRGAINYNLNGNSALARMRKQHYWGVSWRIEGIAYQDPVDRLLRVEKSIRNISVTSNPEYADARVYFVADDPPPVVRINLLGGVDRAISGAIETTLKKQTAFSTVSTAGIPSLDDDRTLMSDQSTTAATSAAVPAAVAAPLAVADPTPTKTAAAAAAAATDAPTPVVAVATNAPPVTAETPVRTPAAAADAKPAEQAEKSAAAAAVVELATPSAPLQQPPQQSHQYQQSAAPVINYNFNVPFGAQNQFGASSSVPSAAPLSTQQQTPMASQTPPVAAATATPVDTPTPVAAAAQAPPVATPAIPQSFLDELRRSIVADVKQTLPDLLKAQAQPPPVPTTAPVPTTTPVAAAASATAAPAEQAEQTAAASINIERAHDGIKRVGQMRDEIAQKENKLDGLRDMLQTEQRLQYEQEIADMKNELAEYMGVLIEGVEKQQKNYRDMFKIKGNPRVDGELARMKDIVASRDFLTPADLNWLGTTLELTSESSGAHRRLNEERERQISAQRQALVSAQAPTSGTSFSTRYSDVAAFRQVLSLDPRSAGTKRAPDSATAAMPPPPKLSRTEEFRLKTGIPYTLREQSEVKFVPPPPRPLETFRMPETNSRFYPPPALTDSIWALGKASDPAFASYINETAEQCVRGVRVEPELSQAALASLASLG